MTFKRALIASQGVVCARYVFTSKLKLLIETAVQRKGKTKEHSQGVVCARYVFTSKLKLLIETAVQRKGKTKEHSSKTAPPFCVE